MGTCRYMVGVEGIIIDIERQYHIRIDHEYTERIKRLICGPLCGGKCNESYMIETDAHKSRSDLLAKEILADLTGMSVNDSLESITNKFLFGDLTTPSRT